MIGVCEYYEGNYKKAIKRFNYALTCADASTGVLENTLKFRDLAQEAKKAKASKAREQWAVSVETLLHIINRLSH